jgi:hypothetical protein
MAVIARLSWREGRFNVVTAAFSIMIAIFSFLFQRHSCFLCGDTNSLMLAKFYWCKLSPVTLTLVEYCYIVRIHVCIGVLISFLYPSYSATKMYVWPFAVWFLSYYGRPTWKKTTVDNRLDTLPICRAVYMCCRVRLRDWYGLDLEGLYHRMAAEVMNVSGL